MEITTGIETPSAIFAPCERPELPLLATEVELVVETTDVGDIEDDGDGDDVGDGDDDTGVRRRITAVSVA
jgi:hypothetical protein